MSLRLLIVIASSIPVLALLANSVVVGLQGRVVQDLTAAVEAREIASQAIDLVAELRGEVQRWQGAKRLGTRLVYWQELSDRSNGVIDRGALLGVPDEALIRLVSEMETARESWGAYREDDSEDTRLFLDYALGDLSDSLLIVSTDLRNRLIDAVVTERSVRSWAIRFGLTMSLMTAVFAIGFAIWFSNRASLMLGDLIEGLARIAEGDLRVRINQVGLTDFARLGESFETMAARLAEVVSMTRESRKSMSEMAISIEVALESAGEGAEQQEQAVEQTARSVLALGETVRAIAVDANALNVSTDSTSDFISRVGRDVAEIAERTGDLHVEVGSIEDSVGHLEGSMEQVAEISSEMKQGALRIDASLGRCQEIIEQVATSSTSNVGYATEVTESAQSGVAAMAETERGMRSIEQVFRQVDSAIGSLYERSESIDRIVGVIGSIADETKLLSLNATIIAAQAGSHGRAFAVVAGQVSQLAQRSSVSAEAVAELVGDVRSEIVAAVEAAEEGTSRVTEGNRLVESARSRLGEIAERAERSQSQSRLIVEVLEEEREALQEVGGQAHHTLGLAHKLDSSTSEQLLTAQGIREALRRANELGEAVRSTTEAQRSESHLIGDAIRQIALRSQQICDSMAVQAAEVSLIEEAAELSDQLSKERLVSLSRPLKAIEGLVSSAESLDRAVAHFKTSVE